MAFQELSFFFPKDKFTSSSQMTPKSIAAFENSTCCIVKPHALKLGGNALGGIVEGIQNAGFNISGLQTFSLKYEHAEEFYEIYKGVVQDYTVR